MGVRLPSAYQEVEYLESTGTQYINTAHNPSGALKISMMFQSTKSPGDAFQSLCGVQNGATRDYIRFSAIYTAAQTQVRFSSANGTNDSASNDFNIDLSSNNYINNNILEYMFDFGSGVFRVGEYSNTRRRNNVTLNIPLYLLARNNNGEATAFASGKLYSAEITDSGFSAKPIPCYRKSDNKPGMYDLVSGTFFTNAGTGEFLVGPNVYRKLPPEYQEVEWIQRDLESSGGAYILTDYVPVNGDSIDATVMVTDSKTQCIFSAGAGTYQFIVLFDNPSAGQTIWCKYFQTGGAPKMMPTNFINTWQHLTVSGTGLFQFAGASVQCNYEAPLDGDYTELMFFSRRHVSSDVGFLGKLKEVVVANNDQNKLHLIPCYRKADSEPGMYDLVSDTFFTNKGTGEFVVGPDVIDSISPWLVARRRMLMARFNVLSSLPEGVKIYLSETVGDVIENVPYIYLGLDDNGNARLLREKTEGARKYANGNSPDYATTLIDAWLENTVDGFLSRFDENVISSLVNTEIKYLNYSQNSSGEISSASRRCFLMSRTEVGFSQTSVGNEGKSFLNALKTYFNTTDSDAARVSKQNENAVSYWLRSAQNTTQMALVWSNGTSNRYGATYAGYYVRPALSLKADTRAKVKNGEYYI